MALASADGTVRMIYNRQKTISLTPEASQGSTRSYELQHMAGMGQYASETTTYYHSDHLGSSRLLTSTNGYPTWQATYLAGVYPERSRRGQELSAQSTVNSYEFARSAHPPRRARSGQAGLERDSESGLDHTWFRPYSPIAQRKSKFGSFTFRLTAPLP